MICGSQSLDIAYTKGRRGTFHYTQQGADKYLRHFCRLLGFLSIAMRQCHPIGVPDPRMSAFLPDLWENKVR
jgi:hypothetical protein